MNHLLMLNFFLQISCASMIIGLLYFAVSLAAIQCLPDVRVQMCRLLTELTPLIFKIASLTSSYFISVGTPSNRIIMQSFTMKYVVNITKIENRNVHIGSIMSHSGNTNIIKAAIRTPTDWIMSPKMCIAAALTFKFDEIL